MTRKQTIGIAIGAACAAAALIATGLWNWIGL